MPRLPEFVLAVVLAAVHLAADEPHPGRRVYDSHCAQCHGDDGAGLPAKNGPTLRRTSWVVGDPQRLIRITLGGLQRRIPLEGGTHYGAMPGTGDRLDDRQVADVLTYVRSSWGNSAPAIAPETVAPLRDENRRRTRPWTAAEFGLEAVPRLGKDGEALEPTDPFAAAGFRIYVQVCQNCHQPDGQGIVTQDGHGYPPLRDSEFVNGSPRRLIRIVLGGLQGSVEVRGKSFSEVMPPWQSALDDEQVAQVLTFVRQAWSNLATPIRIGQVRELRAESEGRGGIPWATSELSALPD